MKTNANKLKTKTGLDKRNKTKPVLNKRLDKKLNLDLTELEIENRRIENYGYFNEYREFDI